MATHALQNALDALKHEFDLARDLAVERSQAELLRRLNQLLRRFRQYRSELEWIQVLTDGASAFAEQTAVFSVENAIVRLRSQVNLSLPPNFSFRLAQARAFAAAFEMKDPVTTLRTPNEVTARLSENRTAERAHLLPVMNDDRVVALLFAAGANAGTEEGEADINALELVCGIAGSVLERRANASLHSQIDTAPKNHSAAEPPVMVANTQPTSHFGGYRTLPAVKPSLQVPVAGLPPRTMPPRRISRQGLPAWTDLAYEQRQLHLRAQRFARVTVAEMQLAKPEACKAGREQNDIYLFLKREIDKARENYRKLFMTVPSMVDYLHLELIHTAAEGDEHKLGAEYPGQLL